MKLTKIIALSAFALLAPVAAANAAPVSGLGKAPISVDSGLIKVHGVHSSCQVGRAGWHRSPRRGRRIECRPRRPLGNFWIWKSEGKNRGWYDSKHKRWHRH